jgi:hypothetical protein
LLRQCQARKQHRRQWMRRLLRSTLFSTKHQVLDVAA